MVQGDGRGSGEEKSASRSILKIDPRKSTNRLDVGYEREESRMTLRFRAGKARWTELPFPETEKTVGVWKSTRVIFRHIKFNMPFRQMERSRNQLDILVWCPRKRQSWRYTFASILYT